MYQILFGGLTNIARLVVLNSRGACSTAVPGEKLNSQVYCLNHVKKYDRENYLAALCIKDASLKRAILALRAFNVELALIRDSTTNSDRAKLRFHFWSKLVDEIVRRNHEAEVNLEKQNAYYNFTPVAKELLDLFSLIDVGREVEVWLKDLIGARLSSKVLGYKPINTLEELELFCSKSNSSLYHLGLTCAHQLQHIPSTHHTTLRRICHILGVAQGLSNVIRGIPYNATKNCCYVPQEMLVEHKLTSRDFAAMKLDGKKINPVVLRLATRCQQLLNEAYSDMRAVPDFYQDMFLPRVAIQCNLNKLVKCGYDISHSSLKKRNHLLPLNLWLATKYFRAPIL